jgi:hypothetical protein
LSIRIAAVLTIAALLTPAARAAELHLQFSALERILGQQVFTQDGRRYLRGDPANKCNFAYLESPRVDGRDGKLRIRARFSGRSSLNMLGQCVGMGDAFSVVITARPLYRDGAIRLRDVTAASDGKTGFYIRRVCTALSSSLERDFRYPIESEARKLLEDPGGPSGYPRELRRFHIPEIRTSDSALILVIDFELAVK